MTTLYQSNMAKWVHTVPIGDSGEQVAYRAVYPVLAALILNDMIEIGVLPADHALVEAIVDTDQLDSNGAPAMTIDVGIMAGGPVTPGNLGNVGVNDTSRTVGTEILSQSTICQTAGGSSAQGSLRDTPRVAPVPYDRSIGIKVHAAPATAVVPLTNLNVNRGQWQPNTVYAQNDFITLPNGVRMKCTTAGTSGAYPPVFPTIYNTTVADGTNTVWTCADPTIAVTVEYRPQRFGY